jgi:hypothetical protein
MLYRQPWQIPVPHGYGVRCPAAPSRLRAAAATAAYLALASVGHAEGLVPPAPIPDHSEAGCLGRPGVRITTVSPPLSAPYTVRPQPGEVFDMRTLVLHAEPPHNPLVIERAEDGVCVVGPTIIGDAPRSATWLEMKHEHDGDGVRFSHARGPFVLEGAHIENVEDAIGPPKAPDTDRAASFLVRGVYACYIRDDFVEDDAALGGEIEDVLVDGAHVFISARPGRGSARDAAFPRATLRVRDSLVHLACMPDDRAEKQPGRGSEPGGSCDGKGSLGMLFKWSQAVQNLAVEITDTVLRVDDRGRNGPRSMDFPDGSYRNVTLVWTGPGAYPGRLPAEGVVVTDDTSVWDRVRADWLRRHGYRVNADGGCARR